jgi:hypothetical protein
VALRTLEGFEATLVDRLKQEERVATGAAFFLDAEGPLRACPT